MTYVLNYRPKGPLELFFIVMLWLQAAPATLADDSVPLSAKVIGIVGSARQWDKENGKWRSLRVGDEVGADSDLQTESKDSTTTDLEVMASDAGGRAAIRMYPNSVLKMIRLSLKKSGSVQARDIALNVPTGQIRVTLDGAYDYAFMLSANSFSIHVSLERSAAGSQQTVFAFSGTGSLTVLKGAVKTRIGSGPERLIQAGEQLREGVDKVTKTPPEAPELKLGQ